MVSVYGDCEHRSPRSGACADLPDQATLKEKLVAARAAGNGRFNLDMWATVSTETGVCVRLRSRAATAVTNGQGAASSPLKRPTLRTRSASRPRALDRESVQRCAAWRQLFGLQESNPVNVDVALWRQPVKLRADQRSDGGGRIGGVNVFGGGLGLYNSSVCSMRRCRRQRRHVVRRSQHRVAGRGTH
jgi:hypothetical protein